MAITRYATKEEAEAVGGQVTWVFDSEGNNWEVRTDSDMYGDLRPTVSKWQFIQACVDAGISEAQLNTAVATLNAKRQRFWTHIREFDRDNPFSGALRSALSPTPTVREWNAIFLAASQLDPLKV